MTVRQMLNSAIDNVKRKVLIVPFTLVKIMDEKLNVNASKWSKQKKERSWSVKMRNKFILLISIFIVFSCKTGEKASQTKHEKQKTWKWEKIAVGPFHVCAINSEKKLYCWGDNQNGHLGNGTRENKETPTLVNNDDWKDVQTGWGRTCAIKTDNSLYCWGYNALGSLGIGTGEKQPNIADYSFDETAPKKVGSEKYLSISASFGHTCGIRENNDLYCWGWNGLGCLGICSEWNFDCDGKIEDENFGFGQGEGFNLTNNPEKFDNNKWKEIAVGDAYSCGIKTTDNSLYCWGSNQTGQLGDSTIKRKIKPVNVNNEKWFSVSVSKSEGRVGHTCAIRSDNSLFCWGKNQFKEGGNKSDFPNLSLEKIPGKWLKVVNGRHHTCGIKDDHKIYCWGLDEKQQSSGQENRKDALVTTIKTGKDRWKVVLAPLKINDDKFSDVSTYLNHTCGLKMDGSIFCWGKKQ